MVYAARWQAPGVLLGLSTFEGLRHGASGAVAASLFLNWEDEATPFPALRRGGPHGHPVGSGVGPAVDATVWQLAHAQVPYTHFNYRQPQPLTDAQRQAQRALYREHLLEPCLTSSSAWRPPRWCCDPCPALRPGLSRPAGYSR